MLALLGGFGAALAWATTTLTAARASRLVDHWSLVASVMAVGLLLSGPLAAASGPPPLDAAAIAWLAVSGGGNVAGLLLSYSAFRIGKVAVIAPITSAEGAIAAILAVATGERLRPGVGAALAVVVAGVALAAASSPEPSRRNDLRALLLACCATVCFGFSLYATGRVGQQVGVAWAALPPRAVGVAALTLPLLAARRLRLVRPALPFVVASGVAEVLGFLSYAFGARHGLAVTAVLSSQFGVLAAVGGCVLFRERPGRTQVAGIATIVAAVSALAVLRG